MRKALLVLAFCGCAASLWAADAFVGTWKFDMAKSPKVTIYRILQDALKNAALHSRADQITVSLAKVDNRVELAIDDNGMGFNWMNALSVESSEGGRGLTSMKKRTELSGGVFSIETGERRGIRIRASWPTDTGMTESV